MTDFVEITLTRRRPARGKKRANTDGLGLKRIGHTVVRRKTPEIMGMVNRVVELVDVKDHVKSGD